MLYFWQMTQWQHFCHQQKQQRLPHALVVTGVEGLGKNVFANKVVASLLCESTDNNEACQQCHSCQLFMAGNHPDHTIIEPEELGKQIKIDQIRRLKDKQELTPTVANWKTVIITPADNMNINANNSLLKLLEEPQQNTLLILITAKPESLPITILSRCQKITLSVPEPTTTINWLQQQGEFDRQVIEQVLPLAKFAPLMTLTMLQSNIIQQTKHIEADFDLMLKGQINPVLLAKDWQQYDLLIVFNHLQNLIKNKLIQNKNEANANEIKRYWYIYDCIIAAIKLTSSSNNINKILLIEQFMVSVMETDLAAVTAINNEAFF